MQVIGFALLFLIAERSIPYGVWGYACRASPYTEEEFIAKYGLISFPRTLLGIAMVLSGGFDYLLPELPLLTGGIFVFVLAAYIGCLGRDVLRAAFR